MSNLQLSANYIENTGAAGFHWGHLQIVYGTQEIEVQSPPSIQNWNGLTNFTYPPVRPHAAHTDGIDTDDRYESVNVEIGDRDAGNVWDILVQIHEQFANRHPSFLYGLGQNSNSYVNTLLWMIGVDVQDHLTEVRPEDVKGPDPDEYNVQLASDIFGPPIFGDPDFWTYFPGVDRNVLTDGYGLTGSLVFSLDDLLGTEGNDFLRTGKGDDSFSAGDGDDTYFAGDGRDTLIGGRGNDVLDGEEGLDTVEYAQALDETVDDRSEGIVAQLDHTGSGTVVDGLGGTDTLSSIESIGGTNFDDIYKFQGSISSIGADGLFYDALDSLSEISGDTIDLSGVTGQGVFVSLDTGNDAQFVTSAVGGAVDSTDAEIILNEFENAIGSEFDDEITGDAQDNILVGGGGADILRGGEGDDTLYFDADDTEISGGSGRDIAIAQGDDGVSVNLGLAGIEVGVGTDAVDVFNLGSGQMAAGGGGADIIDARGIIYPGQTVSNMPSIVWGGSGADNIKIGGGILTAKVIGLTEENFSEFSLDMLGNFDWSRFSTVILNPESVDNYYLGGGSNQIDVRSAEIAIDYHAFEFLPTEPTLENPGYAGPISTVGLDELLLHVGAAGPVSGSFTITPGQPDLTDNISAVGSLEVSFLGAGTHSVQTDVRFGYSHKFFPYDGDGELLGTEGYDLQSAIASTPFEFQYDEQENNAVAEGEVYFWRTYLADGEGYDTIEEALEIYEEEQFFGSWFVVGGQFSGDNLVSSGAVSAVMSTGKPSIQIANVVDINIVLGEGSQTFAGFQPTSAAVFIAGTVINPNAPQAGVTLSQIGNDVVVEVGDEYFQFLDTSLTEWQAAAQAQIVGTAQADDLDGTSEADVILGQDGDDTISGDAGDDIIIGGAGNDTISAGNGDDIIVYTSGDDVIKGNWSNFGADTLDLSKYTADQVSFSIGGWANLNIIITTPDGTITLDHQLQVEELGQARTNITSILFSDGTLDEAGIRERAIVDQTSDGDDTIQGSNYADTIVAGAGDDTISAGQGDDTIVYDSGDDVILGNWSNYGADTLDLSKYTADQVTFSISSSAGKHVIITTPDGQITLGDQFQFEQLGHDRANITTILFSDGTLDEAGIRERAVSDQATGGDDTIQGSKFADTIVGGLGNDIMTGHSGADQFVFNLGEGDDQITDFEDGADFIQLGGTGLSFADLSITDGANGAIVDLAGQGSITLTGVVSSELTESDFLFA